MIASLRALAPCKNYLKEALSADKLYKIAGMQVNFSLAQYPIMMFSTSEKQSEIFRALSVQEAINKIVNEGYLVPNKRLSPEAVNTMEQKVRKELSVSDLQFNIQQLSALIRFFGFREKGSSEFHNILQTKILEAFKSLTPENGAVVIEIIQGLQAANFASKEFYLELFRLVMSKVDAEKLKAASRIQLLTIYTELNCLPLKEFLELFNSLDLFDFTEVDTSQLIDTLWSVALQICNDRSRLEFLDDTDVLNRIEVITIEIDSRINNSKSTLLSRTKLRALESIAIIFSQNVDFKTRNELFKAISSINKLGVSQQHTDPKISYLQDDVNAVLNVMKIPLEIEKVISNYRLDFFLPPRTIIEVNGPSHFISNKSKCEDADLDGKTIIKNYILKTILLYRVVTITHFEWYAQKGLTDKKQFLTEKLQM